MSMPLPKQSSLKSLQVGYRLLILAIAVSLIAVMPACKNSNGSAPTSSGSNTGAPGKSNSTDSNNGNNLTPEAALDALLKGNERYVGGNPRTRDLSKEKLAELAKGPRPTAIVLACSESLVSPELLFDQSIGDLFVIRVAGNIVDKAGMGSIEYAAEQFKTPLIFVLGEEKCGAVTAATVGDGAPGSIQFLVNEIKPAVTKARGLGGDLISKSVDENVRHVVDTMPAKSAIISKLIKENKLRIAGGTYSISDGKVSVVSELDTTPSNN